MENLPGTINKFIQNNFNSGYISDVKITRLKRGIYYRIDINTRDQIYHLAFDNDGRLMSETREPIFSDDYSYSDFFTDD